MRSVRGTGARGGGATGVGAASAVSSDSTGRTYTAADNVEDALTDLDTAIDTKVAQEDFDALGSVALGGADVVAVSEATELVATKATHRLAMSATAEITLPAINGTGDGLVVIVDIASGGSVTTFAAQAGESILWQTPGGSAPTVDTTASAVTVLAFLPDPTASRWLGFASDTTQDAVDAHIADTADAHDASAISVADASGLFTGTDVEAVLTELAHERVLRFVLDGGGSTITTGAKKAYLTAPFDCTITKARLLGDQSGSIVVDVWKDTYANYPPTNDDSITASAPPTVTTATKSEDSTLTGWTTTITAGDILEVNVDSVTSFTKVYLDLFVKVR